MNDNLTPTEKLNELCQFCPPSQLRQSVTTIFFQYLNSLSNGMINKEICEDVHFLINFLQSIENQEQ